ncbi:hypothetical protein [Ferruginibacter profundus]
MMSEVVQTKINTSGSVSIDEDKISWKVQGEVILVIGINEIAVIGEYTTTDGPWFDDWFLVFVKKDGSFFHIPFYVDGRESLLNFLHSQLNADSVFGKLVGSTELRTVVDYPLGLQDQILFDLRPAKEYNPPRTWFDKLLYGVGLGKYNTEKEFILSEPVAKYIKVTCS